MSDFKRQRRADTIAKILILTFNDDEEKAIDKVLSVLSDEIGLEAVQPVTSSVLSFPGLEIKLYQRRVTMLLTPRFQHITLVVYACAFPVKIVVL